MKTASRTKFFIEFYSTCLEGQRGPLLAVGQGKVGCRRLLRVVSPQLGPPTFTPEYKKSFENDAQSSDNINFLKVQWSSRQLPTVRL